MVDDGTALTDPHSVADLYAIGRCEENSAVAKHVGPDLQGSGHDEREVATGLESRPHVHRGLIADRQDGRPRQGASWCRARGDGAGSRRRSAGRRARGRVGVAWPAGGGGAWADSYHEWPAAGPGWLDLRIGGERLGEKARRCCAESLTSKSARTFSRPARSELFAESGSARAGRASPSTNTSTRPGATRSPVCSFSTSSGIPIIWVAGRGPRAPSLPSARPASPRRTREAEDVGRPEHREDVVVSERSRQIGRDRATPILSASACNSTRFGPSPIRVSRTGRPRSSSAAPPR